MFHQNTDSLHSSLFEFLHKKEKEKEDDDGVDKNGSTSAEKHQMESSVDGNDGR